MATENDTPDTVARNHNSEHDATPDATDPERASLLGKPQRASLGSRFREYMSAPVKKTRGDIALLACYPITGLLDSSSIFKWGSFVSMQTGNTIYLGSGIVAPGESNRWLRALISLVFFALGSFSFGRYHQACGGCKRWVLVSSYSVQLLLMVVAAVMVTLGPDTDPDNKIDLWICVPLAILAFQSAGQASVSRLLHFESLTSVVLTSVYLDLFSDQGLFGEFRNHPKRNRRAAAPILLLLGAALGGLIAHSPFGLAGAIWAAVAFKGLVVLIWMLWAEAKPDE